MLHTNGAAHSTSDAHGPNVCCGWGCAVTQWCEPTEQRVPPPQLSLPAWSKRQPGSHNVVCANKPSDAQKSAETQSVSALQRERHRPSLPHASAGTQSPLPPQALCEPSPTAPSPSPDDAPSPSPPSPSLAATHALSTHTAS